MLKNIKIISVLFLCFLIFGCQKATLDPTITCDQATTTHPKGNNFINILNKYTSKGLPGIALLIKDSSGTWNGSSGMA